MSKLILKSVLVVSALMLLAITSGADTEHDHGAAGAPEGAQSDPHGGHAAATSSSATLAGAWSALMAARDAIAADVEKGALGDVHAKAETLAVLVTDLLKHSGDLDADKRARVEGAAKQVTRIADSLHAAADADDVARTRKDLSRLDGLLQLIKAQYPPDALDAGGHDHAAHSAVSGQSPEQVHGAHIHNERPVGAVDAAPRAIIRVVAYDQLRFEPTRIEVQVGVPTRIELSNNGAAEHSLVVKVPGGDQDWVHIHVAPGATEASTYQLDQPGTYPLICSIPGHTEGGMIGELVVVAGPGAARSHQ